MDISLVKKHLPYAESELLAEIGQHSLYRQIPGETAILREGAVVNSLPFVLSGRIKVMSTSREKELLLYYLEPGESCIMSFAACQHDHESKVMAITEGETELLLIPADRLSHWLRTYPSLNRFIINLYNQRYLDLLHTVDQLIFWKMEDRLIEYLFNKRESESENRIIATHQQIANDLGSAREVISRLLKKLEIEGRIQLARNEIHLLPPH